jgi:spore coat polysaccharide biosynthesis protein SpsF (cytidylyltransferase family)
MMNEGVKKPGSAIAVIDVGNCHTPVGQANCGRYATRRLGGQALPYRMARRLSEATRLKHVVISGAHLPTGILTSGLAGVDVLDLPHGHVCERLAAAADRFQADWVVYVPANRPFVDPALIDCLLNRAYQSTDDLDYVGYCSGDGSWDHVRHLGVTGEVCHADALRRLRRNIDRLPGLGPEQSLADWLRNAPGTYEMQLVHIPAPLDRRDLRFAIEDESDWECAEMFSDHMSDEITEWQMLTGLVRDNMHLRDAMAARNRFAQSTNSA